MAKGKQRGLQGRSVFIDAEYLLTHGPYSYMPAKEFGKLFTDLFERLNAGDFEYVSSLPFVIRIVKGSGRRPHIPRSVRKAVWERCGNKCVHCGSEKELQLDHIKAYSENGETTFENLQLLCRICNKKKGPQAGARLR